MKDKYYAYQSVILNVDYYSQPVDVWTRQFGRLTNCFSNQWSIPKPKAFVDKGRDHVINHILREYF